MSFPSTFAKVAVADFVVLSKAKFMAFSTSNKSSKMLITWSFPATTTPPRTGSSDAGFFDVIPLLISNSIVNWKSCPSSPILQCAVTVKLSCTPSFKGRITNWLFCIPTSHDGVLSNPISVYVAVCFVQVPSSFCTAITNNSSRFTICPEYSVFVCTSLYPLVPSTISVPSSAFSSAFVIEFTLIFLLPTSPYFVKKIICAFISFAV